MFGPIGVTRIKIMYVFVEIKFDETHLVECLHKAFSSETRMAIVGAIQFTSVVYAAFEATSTSLTTIPKPNL